MFDLWPVVQFLFEALWVVGILVVAFVGARNLVRRPYARRLGKVADTVASATAVRVYPKSLRGEVPQSLPRDEDRTVD